MSRVCKGKEIIDSIDRRAERRMKRRWKDPNCYHKTAVLNKVFESRYCCGVERKEGMEVEGIISCSLDSLLPSSI